MFICAGESESFEFAIPIGIGLVDSAINLTKICIQNRPDSIIFVGTAGSYGRLKIFDIVKSCCAYNIENSFFKLNSYSPIDNFIKGLDEVSCETVVNSSNYITTDIDISNEYLLKNIDLENMEFFSILKVAKEFNIPAKGIFVVTNYCNADAHKDFLKNHKEAMNLLSKYIIESKI
jgi:nucleoside phosphorylase